MATLHVLRVFVGEGGAGGNPLGVFLSGKEVPEDRRQSVAADLGFSETVFVDDPDRGELRIFTPTVELPFASHPLVGTAWLLFREGFEVALLRPPAGEVPVRTEGDTTYISGRSEWAPPFEHIQLGSPDEVDALTGPPDGHDVAGVWAWEDDASGRARAGVPGEVRHTRGRGDRGPRRPAGRQAGAQDHDPPRRRLPDPRRAAT